MYFQISKNVFKKVVRGLKNRRTLQNIYLLKEVFELTWALTEIRTNER